jgi:probable selenate reductase FAD-binding subunit
MVKNFFAPSELKEALKLKKNTRNAFYLAGGTVLNAGKKKTEISVISLHKLDLAHISMKEGHLHIGAMTPLQELAESSAVKDAGLGELQESCRAISKVIRNMATLGGSIAANYSRSDIIPVLIAASARCLLLTPEADKETEIAVEEYLDLRSKGQSSLIREIKIPPVQENFHIASRRFARTSMDLPIVKVAAGLMLEEARCTSAKIAAGGLGDHVIRLRDVESYLVGRDLSQLPGEPELARRLEASITPVDDIRGTALFKKHIAMVQLEEIIICSMKEVR